MQESSDEESFMKPTKKRRIIGSDEEPDDLENEDVNKIKTVEVEVKKPVKRSLPVAETKPKSQTPKAKVSKKDVEIDMDYDDDGPSTAEKDALLMVDNINKVWSHEKIEFLQKNKIRDKNKNLPSHPEYDPRTVYVPPEFIKEQTPAMAQWWTLKSNHFDCIFFFKVGKFYELYHHDALVGVKELGFTFMGKDHHAHSGFPEQAYEKMASILVERGYKVARVEQTENPGMSQ